ncbi:MAG: DUF1287 domain-containing protein [Akkermansiaceae bacterium]
MKNSAIEYVGATPVRRKRRNPLGGWLLIIFAVAASAVFLRPLFPFLQAQQKLTSTSNLNEVIQMLESEGSFADRLAASALERTKETVAFDNSYYEIKFPGGDINDQKGNRADLIVRAYRGVGIDLQEEVHTDMSSNFRRYPQIFRRKEADPNIDHRLVQNLDCFFSRNGDSLAVTSDPLDYSVGDIVIWRLIDGSKHIGMVVPGPGAKQSEKWVVHNMNKGPVWEDRLFDYLHVGHYRYSK